VRGRGESYVSKRGGGGGGGNWCVGVKECGGEGGGQCQRVSMSGKG
jgi:hypothetical protein